jgi:A/G-specific adenine glycosylase
LGVERLLQILMSPKNIRAFRQSLLRWHRRHGRDLPWRKARDPYAVLVSEFMLQQTQVATVIPYYRDWLRRFPNFTTLAAASENDVLHTWQGLGYYARARHLHAAAKIVRDRHGGRLPIDPTAIRDLPGIGRYTANAIATFAFDQSVPIVDANIARLVARIYNYKQPIDTSRGREAIWQLASALVPKHRARVFNSALMDLGALVCRPQPKCRICPVQKFCRATKPETLPRKRSRPSLKKLIESHLWIRRGERILLEQSNKRWRGMWILPSASSTSGRPIQTSIFPFTHHQVTLQVFRNPSRKIDRDRQRWFSRRALETIPIPSPHRRAIVDLLSAKEAAAPRRRPS